jgi:hypothetical protein
LKKRTLPFSLAIAIFPGLASAQSTTLTLNGSGNGSTNSDLSFSLRQVDTVKATASGTLPRNGVSTLYTYSASGSTTMTGFGTGTFSLSGSVSLGNPSSGNTITLPITITMPGGTLTGTFETAEYFFYNAASIGSFGWIPDVVISSGTGQFAGASGKFVFTTKSTTVTCTSGSPNLVGQCPSSFGGGFQLSGTSSLGLPQPTGIPIPPSVILTVTGLGGAALVEMLRRRRASQL